ncbi:MAG: hypothetical protein B6D34_03655 [Candidatus Brocadia sp. UTAMX1]|jgi:hypothetical protein|nr:MAG: hypothetical protein B6D34_03655 [Candidatus Brocadia sp. UTAMX1]
MKKKGIIFFVDVCILPRVQWNLFIESRKPLQTLADPLRPGEMIFVGELPLFFYRRVIPSFFIPFNPFFAFLYATSQPFSHKSYPLVSTMTLFYKGQQA